MRIAALAAPVALAIALMTVAVQAHPGALDANGCHHLRRTGRTVCHAGHVKPGEHRRYVGFDGVVRHFSR